MDGHDTSADKDSGNSTASGAQGIFSTPDLTIDANNISPNYDSEKSRSRVASIFANTDAGQRSQKLNNAMGISSRPVQLSQPVAEDVVINNTPRKRSKVPFIIIAAVIALALIAGGIWLAFRGANTQKETLSELYTSFMTYIQNSPTGDYIYIASEAARNPATDGAPQDYNSDAPESSDEPTGNQDETDYYIENENDGINDRSQWFISIADKWLNEEELNSYYNEVSRRYYKFIDKARTSKVPAIKTTADSNYETFPAVFAIIRQEVIEKTIAKYVYNEDIAGAENYVRETLPAESSREIVRTMMSNFSDYLRQSISIYQMYNYSGCLSQDGLNWACAASSENKTAESANLEAMTHLNIATILVNSCKTIAFDQFDAFAKLMEGSNE